MTTAHLRAIDQQRAARVALAFEDGDVVRANRVLVDANEDDSVHMLVAALVSQLLIALAAPELTDAQIRDLLERTILDAQMAGDDE
ncbi:hypothetical protein ACTWP6_17730 [Mycobacterium sp. 4D054]|uniref:hypothetical protein n=1 Tax=Mycobacterium sp. 4D054 TaxID=3457440 RepID=UPI003FD4E690